jgi:lysyl endopeptidase
VKRNVVSCLAGAASGLAWVLWFAVSPTMGQSDDLAIVPVVAVPFPDLARVQAEDEERAALGLAPRFAIPNEVLISPATDGVWKDLDERTRQWRLRITSPGALSLNLGFTAYFMPPGGQLWLYATDGSYALEPYTDFHNADHGELWTAVVLADDILVEVTLPAAVEKELILHLTSINVGYRGFGETQADKAGACNIDVICPVADAWRNEIPAIGVISTGGSLFCTGFMVNNTAQDQTPYFMTAYHCGVTSSNAASLVVYWNFYSPTCGQHGGGSLSQYQSGSTWRAGWSTSDFTLVQLSQMPNPAWGITYAGWDRRDVNATSAVGIHHPNCDEKSISFTDTPTKVTSYLGESVPGDGTHLWVRWETNPNRGVTEPGSSGSPIFDQNHRVLGQLHGGYSACNSSDMRDWYGRFYRSWTGGGTNTTRLSNWLDPGNTGLEFIDTLNPYASGILVTPSTGLEVSGDVGGPFTPASKDYTVRNNGSTPLNYQVTRTQPWLSILNASGTLAGGQSVTVTVALNAQANSLSPGTYTDTIRFINLTDQQGTTTRSVTLRVGVPRKLYEWPLNTNPGWTTQGEWAFGQPTGQGGRWYGRPDPTSGYTGSNVYGVNLNGDYSTTPGGPYYVSTGPVDLASAVQTKLRFRRWLNSDHEPYAYAHVWVSTNGSTWTRIWRNGTATITDSAWSLQEYDISGLADRQPSVWFRWGYEVRSGAWPYSGWNIDDIEVWGVSVAGPSYPPGDMNCDGEVTFADIDLFVEALAGQGAWSHPDCPWLNADINGDGDVTYADIDPFVGLLGGTQ